MKRYRQFLDRLHALALGPTLLLLGLPLGSLLYGLQQHTFRPLLWAGYCQAASLRRNSHIGAISISIAARQ